MNSFNLAFVSAFATLRSGALPDIQASNILYLIVSRGRSGCGKRLFRRRRSPRPSSGMQTSICTISLTQCEVAHSQDDEHINASAAASLRAAHLGRGARGWPFKSILWPGLSSGRSRQRIPPCSSTSSAKEDNKMSACTARRRRVQAKLLPKSLRVRRMKPVRGKPLPMSPTFTKKAKTAQKKA